MNLTFHIALCTLLALIVVALFLYRRWLENHDDHYIHLHNDAHDSTIVTAQNASIKRFELIDKVKNGLLVAVIVYAVAIIAMAGYVAWNSAATS